MRLEDWQKWLETQFVDPAEVNATQHEASGVEEIAPSTAEEIADAVVAHAPTSAPAITRQPEPPAATPAPAAPAATGLVDEVEVPSIERYLPFLKAAAPPEPPPAPAIADPVPEEVAAEPVEHQIIAQAAAEPAPVAEVPPAALAVAPPLTPAVPAPALEEEPAIRIVRRPATVHQRVRPAAHTDPAAIAQNLADGGLWELVPRHIQTLVSLGDDERDEVARNSYKREFRESRIELIGRLLDPTLSLEETARLLNVCPTTVRRYTNRGLLTHQRTQGDQRRFKLSDVLAFLESQSRTDLRKSA
jgi:excisionase family DNA binding protein